MKIKKHLLTIALLGVLFTACSGDDNGDIPEPVNEEELITTMTVTLTPVTDGDSIILTKRDTDGDGPNAPEVTVSGNLDASLAYNGRIAVLNETISPPEDITTEVRDESNEHQFLFASDSDLDVTFAYDDVDDGGNPLGIEFILTAGEASEGNITIVLRHEPIKPNDGTFADAGGETDAEATFPIVVE